MPDRQAMPRVTSMRKGIDWVGYLKLGTSWSEGYVFEPEMKSDGRNVCVAKGGEQRSWLWALRRGMDQV